MYLPFNFFFKIDIYIVMHIKLYFIITFILIDTLYMFL